MERLTACATGHYESASWGGYFAGTTRGLADSTFALTRVGDDKLQVLDYQSTVVKLDSANNSTINFSAGTNGPGSHYYTSVTYYHNVDSIVWYLSSGGMGGGGSFIFHTY
ncbi:MAG: hypothetical protein EOP51_01075 [Sphingobacteriales bacterium]|nr:MAG: hypothetical protein EOP51_01075 [Sphingobacteriales bacterium]